MSPFLAFAVALMLSPDSADAVSTDPDFKVEFRWIENLFVEGVTEKQPRIIGPCDEGGWYVHRKPALTTEDFADAKLETTLVAGEGVVGRQYLVRFQLSDNAIEKLVEQCGKETRKRIVAVYVKYQGGDAEILPSPIRYFPAVTFDRSKPNAFQPPIIGFMKSKEHANQILQASR